MIRTVYIISGPCGVGKTTLSMKLVKSLYRSAYISGDTISNMPVNGRQKPWEDRKGLLLTWKNIASLTHNLLENGYDVVVDYVAMLEDVGWLNKQISEVSGLLVKYIILMTDTTDLQFRDSQRPAEKRMGLRALELHEEFSRNKFTIEQFMVDTSKKNLCDDDLINDIKSNVRFIFHEGIRAAELM